MNFFAAILAIIKAIPVVDSWIQQFIAFYVAQRVEQMKKEDRDAIRKIIEQKDQRDFEKLLGTSKAGLPSGDAGAVIIDPSELYKPQADSSGSVVANVPSTGSL